ncbi:MAG: hypothetical protein GXP14_11280 [Gammaproteobacteria bacterium]|nr:hypothetical protein [Gammaproteobacteria bacterium]
MEKRTYYINNEAERNQLILRMGKAKVEKPWVVAVSFVESVRSAKQNRLYWMWIQEIINHITVTMGETKTKRQIDAWLLDMFAPTEQSEFRGKNFTVVTTTSDMTQKQMSQYLNNIELYCPTELELVLTHPPDLYETA